MPHRPVGSSVVGPVLSSAVAQTPWARDAGDDAERSGGSRSEHRPVGCSSWSRCLGAPWVVASVASPSPTGSQERVGGKMDDGGVSGCRAQLKHIVGCGSAGPLDGVPSEREEWSGPSWGAGGSVPWDRSSQRTECRSQTVGHVTQRSVVARSVSARRQRRGWSGMAVTDPASRRFVPLRSRGALLSHCLRIALVLLTLLTLPLASLAPAAPAICRNVSQYSANTPTILGNACYTPRPSAPPSRARASRPLQLRPAPDPSRRQRQPPRSSRPRPSMVTAGHRPGTHASTSRHPKTRTRPRRGAALRPESLQMMADSARVEATNRSRR